MRLMRIEAYFEPCRKSNKARKCAKSKCIKMRVSELKVGLAFSGFFAINDILVYK